MNEQLERTAFETWARREKGWSTSLIRGSDDAYILERARAAWDGWQARATQPRFQQTFCSQCGASLGPGNEGVSSCGDHT